MAKMVTDSEDGEIVLNAGQKRQIATLKPQVRNLAGKFTVIRAKVKEIAPKVLAVFNAIKAEHGAFTFVQFAREFDSSIPTFPNDKEGGVIGYKNHKVYYTLDYMRRVVNLKPRGKGGKRIEATDWLARSIATVLAAIDDPAAFWTAVASQMDLDSTQLARLQRRVKATQPLVELRVQRPARVGNVIQMTPPPATETAAPVTEVGKAMAKGRKTAAA